MSIAFSKALVTKDSSMRSRPSRWNGYATAILSVAVASLLAFLLRDYLLVSRSIFVLFAAPVAFSAWYAGSDAALLATLGGLFAADFIFFERGGGMLPSNSRDFVAIAIYLGVSLLIVRVSSLFTEARDELLVRMKQLEEQAIELQSQAAELEHQTEEAQTLNEELEQLNRTLEASSAAQLAEAQSLAKLGSWEWDVKRNSVKWSDEMYRVYGLEPGSIGIDFGTYLSFVHPEDRDISQQAVAESLDSGEPFSFHQRIVRPDGEVRILLARGKVIRDEHGKPIRMIGTGQDVTDARKAEAVLRNAAEFAARQKAAESAAKHLDRVLAQAPVVIAVLKGPEHVFEIANEKAVEMLGNREIVGRAVGEVIPGFAGGRYVKLLDDVYATGKPFVGREMFASIDPQRPDSGGYFNFVLQPLFSDEGVYAILVVAHEVSDLVNARLNAEHSQREALAASRTKSEFLARMSHELRTPLAAIMGYGELLADGITGPVNEEQSRQLGRIRSSANHLLSIIDEILTLARMEAGKEKVHVEEFGVHELLDSVASMAEPLAAAKGLQFKLGPVLDLRMQTDAMKVRQVLLNLISNAVKYTDNGIVTLGSDQADGRVDFFVSDTGLGVSEDHLEKIFEPFWQVEQTTTRRSGGTGLGLAVTRQFVDLLGGQISVESALGKGSTFRVSLPLQHAEGSGVAETLET